MTEKEEFTTKFKVDIAELKANFQEANRQIKLINSEFKAATAGMDDWSGSADGLSAKLKQLNNIHEAEIKKLDSLKQQYALIVEEQGENSKAAQNLMVKINNQQAAVSRTEKAINQYNDQLEEITASSNQAETASQQLTKEINDQETELNQLKSRYKDVILTQGDASEEAQQLAAQITNLNADLQANKIKMADADDAAEKLLRTLDNTEAETKEASHSFTLMDGILAGLISHGIENAAEKVTEFIGSLFELGDATEEYRSMMAKVKGSANSFGYSVDFAKSKYKDFYAYLKDDQMATNAITNLMGMKVSTDTVSKAANAAIAVWSAYGDSIPIEGLTEAINESAQVGKVTASLADTINWAKRSNDDWSKALSSNHKAQDAFNKAIKDGQTQEDAYSAALAACSDTQERATLIADTLNQTYGKSKTTYDTLAGSLIDANKAELELKETQADLADTLAPLQTEFTRLQNKALKALSPAIEDVTDDFVELLEDIDWDGAADTIGSLLETTADGLQFVAKNISPISAGVKGMAVAWATYKTAQLAANGATKASTALLALTRTATTASTAATVANTAATNSATVATKALALAQKLTPWGLVASLVAGAAVALGSYIASSKKATNESDANTIATNKLAKEYKNVNDALKENKRTRDDALQSAAAEVGSAEIMAKKLDELANKENKSNAEKKQMQYYVDQLNELIPDLNLQYDQEKDALNKSTSAIKDNIKAQKDLALAKAAQENLNSIAKDMANTEIKLADAVKQHAKNEKELTAAKKETAKAQEAWAKAGYNVYGQEYQAFVKASESQEKLQSNYDKSKKAVDGYKSQLNKLNGEFEKTDKYAQSKINATEIENQLNAIVAKAKAQGVEVPKAISKGISEGSYAVPASVEEMKALINYNSLTKQAKDNGLKVPTYLSDGIRSGKMSPSQAVAEMQSLVQFGDLLNKAQQAGFDVPEKLKNNVLNGKTKPQEAVQQMQNLVQFNDLLQKSSAAGASVPANIQQAVLSGKMSPSQAVAEMNNLMIGQANSAGPGMRTAGSNSGLSFTQGLDSKKGDAKNSGSSLASNAKKGAGSKTLYDEGDNAGSGFIKGITKWVSDAWDAGWKLVTNAINGGKKAQKSHSPSRVWDEEVGQMSGAGYVVGLEKSEKSVNMAAAKMVRGAIDTVDEMSSDFSVGEMLKLDDIKAGLNTNINGIQRSKSLGSTTAQEQAPVKNITFNQYNTSPKALSRLDLYRQTNNQLLAAKRRLNDV